MKMLSGRGGARCCSAVAMLAAFSIARAEGEEESVDPVTIAVSVMLIGSITFQMSLFYLTNHYDEDIQRYSYQVIGNTISIFAAVLVFQGFNGVIEEKIIKQHEEWELFIDFCVLLFFFILLQIVTAVICHQLKGKDSDKDAQKHTERNLKCFSGMMAHMTGFAAINAFTTLQARGFFMTSWMHSFCILPTVFFLLNIIFFLTDFARQKITMADGKLDKYEELWDEETEEAENDVIGLALSFTTVQAIRYFTEGHMPDKEGEPEGHDVSYKIRAAYLVGFSVFCAALTAMLTAWASKQDFMSPEEEDDDSAAEGEHENGDHVENGCNERKKRYVNIFQNYTVMCFAWSSLFWAKLLIEDSGLFHGHDSILSKVCLALFLSFGSFAIIFVLDKIADSDATDATLDKAIKAIIGAKALCIGFSWEAAFDGAVEEVADTPVMKETFLSPAETKMVVTLVLAALVVPAYKKYILPIIIDNEEKEEEDEKEEDRKSKHQGLHEPLLAN